MSFSLPSERLLPFRLLPLAVAVLALAACRADIPKVLQSAEYDAMLKHWNESMAPERRGQALPDETAAQGPEGVGPPLPQLIGDQTPYALQLRSAELSQALMLIAEMGSLNLMLEGDFSIPVQLNLPAVGLQAALEMLVAAYGCSVEVVAGDIVLVRRRSPNERQSRVFVLQSLNASEIEAQLVAMLGSEAVVVNTQRNVVLVNADRAAISLVETYLAAVDRPQRQVLIEARILEVSRSDLLELGAAVAENSINLNDWTASFVTDLLSPSPKVVANIGGTTGAIDITLDALQTIVDLRVLQRPRLMALHGSQATLEIIQEVPYIDTTATTQSSGGTLGTQTIQEVQFKNIGLKLSILPSIQEDGLVALAVEQTISVQSGTFNDIPIVKSRNLTTSFLVEEGETIVIGGIMENGSLESTAGVPLLKDIPLLGHFFSNTQDELTSTELIILMTPRLVDPWTVSGAASSSRLNVGSEGNPGATTEKAQDRPTH